MTGSAGQKRVPKEYFSRNPFPLPPLPEQHRIVAKVDALMALCDDLEARQAAQTETHTKLGTAALAALSEAEDAAAFEDAWSLVAGNFDVIFDSRENVAALRQTVLQLAVQGRLVEQDPADEPAAVLLERIAAEKKRLVKEGVIGKIKVLPQVGEENIPFNVPNTWRWIQYGNLFQFIDYRGKTPPKTNYGIRLITAKNVRMGYINKNPEEFIAERDYIPWMTRGFPEIGDLLFTTEAPMGKIAIFNFSEKIALAQRIITLHPYLKISSDFFKYAIMSPDIQKDIESKATGMTAKGIKASRLKEMVLPLPPLPEQHRIVAKVDALMALCDDLDARITEREEVGTKLVESVVAGVSGC